MIHLYKSFDMWMDTGVCNFKSIPSTRCIVEAHLDPIVHSHKNPWLRVRQAILSDSYDNIPYNRLLRTFEPFFFNPFLQS